MNILDNFLSYSPFTRPGIVRKDTLAIVLHWVAGQKKQTAVGIRNYFESLKDGPKYASIQYVIGFDGTILRIIPDEERAFHVGAAGKVDPSSGKLYTDYAREKFGVYAKDERFSPSYCTVGIELCQYEDDGRFSKETLTSASDLCTYLLKKYGLDAQRSITTHNQVVGWKDCPRWFVNHPEDLADFKNGVSMKVKG